MTNTYEQQDLFCTYIRLKHSKPPLGDRSCHICGIEYKYPTVIRLDHLNYRISVYPTDLIHQVQSHLEELLKMIKNKRNKPLPNLNGKPLNLSDQVFIDELTSVRI